ncbi:MAG TPA: glycosyltransferase [Gaiellaceae bacterium]|nr:glycosyltransferase [Gaiellaceae bacterium]
MRVLFLTCHLPYPPVSGGRVREYELLRRLVVVADVHVCAVSKTYEDDLAAAPSLADACASVSVHRARAGTDDLPAQLRRHCAADASLRVRELLDEVDLVHVEGFYLMHHVPERSPVPVLLVEQNVEYSLWAQRVAVAGGWAQQRAAFREFRETRVHEVESWRRADLCAAVTEDDRDAMLRAAPALDVRVVPDGFDHLGAPPGERPEPRPELVFVGNFAYEPNADAARWFCGEILPRVRWRVPAARALLVGNAPPPEVLELGCDHVEVTGRVPSVADHLDRAAVVVSPLRVGGGIKVKVLEALCRGKAIVSTSVGVQGLGPHAWHAIEVADDPARFAEACARLLLDRESRRSLERRATRLAETLPTWDEAAATLLDCYHELAAAPAMADAEGAKLR